ncbi:MAG: site-specific DNA-methyltransferase [Chlorobiales bacterium]|nr:site-specific DNA-methyltransferase [Chlorobiales bacterium]
MRHLLNSIVPGDCFDILPDIADKSINMVLCDLPYGVTACKWDQELDLDRLWPEYDRILAPKGVVVLTAIQPFETKLINSKRKWFRYKVVWKKSRAVGFLNAKKMPLRIHEDVLVFAKRQPKYNPQFSPGKPYVSKRAATARPGVYRNLKPSQTVNTGVRYPQDVVEFSNTCEKVLHSTQKPVALFEYFIRTYTDEGDVVLDNTSGSGTTAIAAMNAGRQFICIEKNLANYRVSVDRLNNHKVQCQSTITSAAVPAG